MESQLDSKEELDIARDRTDQSLEELEMWPGLEEDGAIYKSSYLFAAVLQDHREGVQNGKDFWDEVQFYTDVIDVVYGWLHKKTYYLGDGMLWKWVTAYDALMGSINYLGAEQALCSVFHSIICFTHRQTYFYANYSFSGEAAFRMYRQAFPLKREEGWKITSHQNLFPSLYSCRQEIISDLDYMGMSIDPSLCDYSRKNETRFQEVELLTIVENNLILTSMNEILNSEAEQAVFNLILSCIILGTIVSYMGVLHLVRCSCIKCVQWRKGHKWKLQETDAEEEKLDHMALQQTSKMIQYEEYNCKPNSCHTLHVKVATV